MPRSMRAVPSVTTRSSRVRPEPRSAARTSSCSSSAAPPGSSRRSSKPSKLDAMRVAWVVLVVLLGCGPKQIVTPGQVVVDGDVTFSTKTGNAIDVIVHKTWDGHEATGLATLHGITLEAAKASPLLQVAGARAWLAI